MHVYVTLYSRWLWRASAWISSLFAESTDDGRVLRRLREPSAPAIHTEAYPNSRTFNAVYPRNTGYFYLFLIKIYTIYGYIINASVSYYVGINDFKIILYLLQIKFYTFFYQQFCYLLKRKSKTYLNYMSNG